MARQVSELRETRVFDDSNWRSIAACKGKPTSWWYPEKGHSADTAKLARSICRTCPVINECYQFAIDYTEQGIWGDSGTKERQRYRALGNGQKRLVCQYCRFEFKRPAIEKGTRLYCSTKCSKRAANNRESSNRKRDYH